MKTKFASYTVCEYFLPSSELSFYHFKFLPAKHEETCFFTSLPAYVVFWLFDSGHPSGCEVVFYCGVDLFFSDEYCCWVSFVVFSHLYIFFGEMSTKMLCPILIMLSFYYWIVSYLFFLVTSALWDIWFADFFPSLWIGLSLSSCALWSTRILNLDEVQFIYFFFSFFCLWYAFGRIY